MKKKALLLASIAVLACTVGVTALAVGGANQLDRLLQVKADPNEYSFTFTESNTTVEKVGIHYAIYATTPRGAKVGVVGYDNSDASFTFKGISFRSLLLCNTEGVLNGRAYDFGHLTGFAISFSGISGDDMVFLANGGETTIEEIVSGKPYTELSFAPEDCPMFYTGDRVEVSSLKIWYSC